MHTRVTEESNEARDWKFVVMFQTLLGWEQDITQILSLRGVRNLVITHWFLSICATNFIVVQWYNLRVASLVISSNMANIRSRF